MTISLTCKRAVTLFMCAILGGCSSMLGATDDTFKPYVPEVVQGNFVSREQRQAISLGMPRARVKDILGTPLVVSLFHGDRWDYVFSIRRQGVAPQNFQLTVYFKDDVVSAVQGDDLLSEAEFVRRLVAQRKSTHVPILQAGEEDLKNYPTPTPEPAKVSAPLPVFYPPLEPTIRPK